MLHTDPFDRMLIAQASYMKASRLLPPMSRFRKYKVRTLW